MTSMTDQEFRKFADYIKLKLGVHLGPEKKTLMEGRLNKVLLTLRIPTIEAYYQYLTSDKTGEANTSLVNAITTNHTFFMRETEHFEYYANSVLPTLAQSIHDLDLRTWCAACSSGQEAYTLAMLIRDFFATKASKWDTKLLATDISLSALTAAKQGIYSKDALKEMPSQWVKTYFKQLDALQYQIKPELKSEVIFRQFNLMTEQFPFKKKFHTIFCRNVMIYFDLPTRQALVRKFHQYLEPGGYLFIGQSEVIDRSNHLFKYVMPSVYRKE